MKKILKFARSMRFGVILLVAIAILCALATVLQDESVYHSWYFILLFILLCVNLLFCSVLRVRGFGTKKQSLIKRAENAETQLVISRESQEAWLRRNAFRKQQSGGFLRFGSGFAGSFVTHIALLLLLIAASCNFMLSEKTVYQVFVGDSATLPDGTVLTVDAFSTANEENETEYDCLLTSKLPDGTEISNQLSVNHPARIGQYKVYQQSFSNAAVIGVRTGIDEPEERVCLDDSAFLSLDGEKGIYYVQMFGNVVEDETGVLVSSSNELLNPAYEIQVINGEAQESGLVFPGTTLEAGGVYYTMYEPESYPGLCVKSQPEWTLWLLYLAFALMIVGLYLCFFHVPISAVCHDSGITFASVKDIDDWIEEKRVETEENRAC